MQTLKRKRYEEAAPHDIPKECDPSEVVGALVMPVRLTGIVRKLLDAQSWLEGMVERVTPYRNDSKEEMRAIHVTGPGAACLNNYQRKEKSAPQIGLRVVQDELPPELAEFLEKGDVEWLPGVRALDDCCLGFVTLQQRNPRRKFPQKCSARNPVAAEEKFTYCELFAGIGGFRVALDQLGGKCVFASEIDPLASSTYIANFGGEHLYGNIMDVPASRIPDHDVLTAGFPCQSFSKAGDQQGLLSDKGNLFFEVTRVLRAKQPKAFMLENVANLVFHDEGRTMATVREQLRKLDYSVHYRILNAKNVVPQQRQRVYIVGFRNDLTMATTNYTIPSLPETFPYLESILEENVQVDYRLTDQRWEWLQKQQHFIDDPSSRIADVKGIAKTLMSSYKNSYRRYTEFVKDKPYLNPRFFTPRECARLQGFPEEFIIDKGEVPKTHRNRPAIPSRIYHQLGNAVCPLVIRIIAESFVHVL